MALGSLRALDGPFLLPFFLACGFLQLVAQEGLTAQTQLAPNCSPRAGSWKGAHLRSFTPRFEKVAVWAEIAAAQLAPQMSGLMDTQTFPRSCIGKANNPSCCMSFPSHSGAGCSLEMRPAAKSRIALRVPPFKVPLSLHPFSSPLHLFIYLFYHLGFYEMLAGFLQPVAFLE